MPIGRLAFVGLIGLGAYAAASAGLFGSQAQSALGGLGLGALGAPTLPCPTADELAKSLGVSSYKVRTAMAQTGKNGCTLSLSDLSGVPQVPASVVVNGVTSYPQANGVPASWQNPSGSSGSWGGLSDSQIQAAFIAAAGGNVAQAQANWQAEHAAQVAANGF